MTHPNKLKGNREERSVVESLKNFGLNAWRVPLSGAAKHLGKDYSADVVCEIGGEEFRIECKVRNADFKRIYDLLEGMGEGNNILTIRSNYRPRIFIMFESTFGGLINAGRTLVLQGKTNVDDSEGVPREGVSE